MKIKTVHGIEMKMKMKMRIKIVHGMKRMIMKVRDGIEMKIMVKRNGKRNNQ